MATLDAQRARSPREAIVASALSMVVVDSEGVVVFANPAAQRLFHETSPALVGARFGFPLVTGESTRVDIVSAGKSRVAEMRALPIDWEGRPSTLAALKEHGPARPRRPDVRTRGGQAAEISTGIVRLHHEFFGRGPTEARTRIAGDTVVCLLRDCFTSAERILLERGHRDKVGELRELSKEIMREPLERVVEAATGRRVAAYLSQIHTDPDLIAEIFVLEADRAR